ncbi:MAG: NPXTG-anchored protein [Oscillospiraceae bacterium]|nr:NPXTG-anchored protein [Oscillospiraceae bacterium]
MKIKSVIAAVAASAIAVIAAAPMSASADAAKLKEITGITFYITCPTAATADAEGALPWYGGAFGVNSDSTGWSTVQWAVNEDPLGDGKVAAEKIDDTHYKVTWTDKLFTGEETWAQAVYQSYGPADTKLEKVTLEGVNVDITEIDAPDAKGATAYLFGDSQDGNWHGVFNDEAEPTEGTTTTAAGENNGTTTAAASGNKTTTAASGSKGNTTTATKTGDAGVGVVVAGLTLAGAAALIARKKH